MSERLKPLAQAAGVAFRWQNYRNEWQEVAPDAIRAVLTALGLPANSDAQIAESRAHLAQQQDRLYPLVTATIGESIPLPGDGHWTLTLEDGTSSQGQGELPPIHHPGYHSLLREGQATTIAVAPKRCHLIAPGTKPWALAVQLYALRHDKDGGVGDFRAVQELAGPAAALGAAAIAISPVHAQFSADIERFSPYSPSSRMLLNVLHTGLDLPDTPEASRLSAQRFVAWPEAARLRLDTLRHDFEAATPTMLAALAHYRAQEGEALESHARFEALHAVQFAQGRWHWRTWPTPLQDPASPEVQAFADQHPHEIAFHAYMQWRARQSLQDTQAACRTAGMPIGLIADLAVGADSGGSQCWARQAEILPGMTVGAPPDLLSVQGQSWGLAAFSPTGLRENGFRAFIEMLRGAMRHAGGVRIDHALGLARLWVVPDGGSAKDGTYLSYPLTDLLRLVALESTRHRAIVLGEDLGTIPEGFQDSLADAGILGMRVLWFERQHQLFTAPASWTKDAAAMTSTHDLPTVAGWWAGRDLEWRAKLGLAGSPKHQAREEAERSEDRSILWSALQHSGAATTPPPPPGEPAAAVDAAARHLATAASDLVILPIEDALGLIEQPNLPGTMDDQHPNWRRRLDGPAATLLDPPEVAARLTALTKARTAS